MTQYLPHEFMFLDETSKDEWTQNQRWGRAKLSGMYGAHSYTDTVSQSLLYQLLIVLLLVMSLTDHYGATVIFTFLNTLSSIWLGDVISMISSSDSLISTRNFVCLGLATHAGEVQRMRRHDASYMTKSSEIRMPFFSLSPFLALMFIAFRSRASVITFANSCKRFWRNALENYEKRRARPRTSS